MRDGSSDSFGDGHTGSDSDEADSFQRRGGGFAEQTRMNDESSEEDELAAAPTVPRVSEFFSSSAHFYTFFIGINCSTMCFECLCEHPSDWGLGSSRPTSSTKIWG